MSDNKNGKGAALFNGYKTLASAYRSKSVNSRNVYCFGCIYELNEIQ